MSIQVWVKTGKIKWTESDQHRQRRARALLSTYPLEKGIGHGCQGGSIPYSFTLPHTQTIVGVGHLVISNLLGDLSGLYGVFFG